MVGTFSLIWFPRSASVLLTVGLLACSGLALSGCRCLMQQSPTTVPSTTVPSTLTPPVSPDVHFPKMEEPDNHSAFRPIMPGEFHSPVFSASTGTPPEYVHGNEGGKELPIAAAQPDDTIHPKIEELNQRIAELETQLAEAKKIPPPVVAEIVPPVTEKMEAKPAKSLPIVNKQGLLIYSDESQNVRIEVMDKILFMPNVWQLSAEGEETLRTIAAEIRASDAKAILEIEGHTDSLMSDPNNPMQKHEIASAKVRTVMDFFVNALRWDVARIGTSSFGRSRPVAENGTPEGRARNNRIEIVIRDGSD